MEKVPSLRPAVDASGMSTSCGRHRGGTTKPSAHDTLPLAFPLSLPHSPSAILVPWRDRAKDSTSGSSLWPPFSPEPARCPLPAARAAAAAPELAFPPACRLRRLTPPVSA